MGNPARGLIRSAEEGEAADKPPPDAFASTQIRVLAGLAGFGVALMFLS